MCANLRLLPKEFSFLARVSRTSSWKAFADPLSSVQTNCNKMFPESRYDQDEMFPEVTSEVHREPLVAKCGQVENKLNDEFIVLPVGTPFERIPERHLVKNNL